MFGQANKPAFGSSGFGTQNGSVFGTTNVFGSQTPTANTGGLFSTTTTQSGNIFGGGTSTFGQSSAGGFGSQQTSKTSLFSTNGQQSTNLFSTPASNGFGAKTPAPAVAAFGSTLQNPGTFGTTVGSGTSLFGPSNSAVSSTSNTLFGSASTPMGQSGTTIKFNPPSGQDSVLKGGVSTSISTRHQCISAMKEYEAKSMEELRAEDYVANRKGPQAGSTGVFSNTQNTQAQTAFSFGAQNKTAGFGGFSQTTTAGGASSLFSQPQQAQSGGVFGAATSNTTFGASTSAANTGFAGFGGTSSLLGQTSTNKSLLGQPTSTQSGGLFGTTQTTSSALTGFGNPQTTFGTNTQAGGLFGKTTLFAQPAASTGLNFGQQSALSAGGLFANKSTTGQTSTAINFGQTPATGFGTGTTGLFGGKTGFGVATNTLGATGFGQVGTGLNTGLTVGLQNKPGLSNPFSNTALNLSNPGLTQNVANNAAMAAQALALQNENEKALNQLKKTLVYSPYGDSPLFRNLENSISREDLVKPTNPVAQKAALSSHSQYKVSPRPVARIKPKVLNAALRQKSQLFDGLEEEDLSFGNVTFVPRRSVKKLTIKGGSPFSKPNSWTGTPECDTSHAFSPPQTPDVQENERQEVTSNLKMDEPGKFDNSQSASEVLAPNGLFQNISESFLNDTISDLNGQTPNNDINGQRQMNESPVQTHPAGIILCRHGYYTLPPLKKLAELLDENGNCIVNDFVIGREGYGNVMYPGETNISNLNLDEIVHFRRKEITVYPSDDEKPPVGCGLNKKAQVTLHCVWPCDDQTREYVKDVERLAELHYQEKLERITAKIGAKFLDYRPETGSWVFEVKHFSKYGLLDEDDDDDSDAINSNSKNLAQLKQQQQQQLAIQKQQIKVSPDQPLPVQGKDTKPQAEAEQVFNDLPADLELMKGVPHPLLTDLDCQHDSINERVDKEYNAFDDIDSSERAPTSQQLASHLGVMAESLQLKKASFFGDDDFLPAYKDTAITEEKQLPWLVGKSLLSTSYNKSVRCQSPQKPALPRLLSASLDTSFSGGLKPGLMSVEPIQFPSKGIIQHKHMMQKCKRRATANLNQSLFKNRQKLIADLGLFQAKQFRVGWGPQWNLVHGGKQLTSGDFCMERVVDNSQPQIYKLLHKPDQADKCRLQIDHQQLLIEQLTVSPLQQTKQYISLLHQVMIDHLTVQLKYSHITLEHGSPLAVPYVGSDILKPLANCAQNALNNLAHSPEYNFYRQSELVWELCQALWGNMDDHFIEDVKAGSYMCQVARQDALSKWLEKAVSSSVNQEIEEIKAKCGSEACVVFQLLTGHQLEQACSVAQQEGDHHLALLIGQASNVDDNCKRIAHQLAIWAQSEMDEFVVPDRLKIYALLAGMFVWITSSGQTVNVCENLDWKRAMALHLWYLCPPTCTVPEALASYREAFDLESGEGYAAPPLPAYLEAAMQIESKQDVCYQLIQLFCDRSYPLHKLLNPTSAVENCLDYRLSWHLYQVLQALGYTHLSEYHSAMLCTSFAAQLESLGLWHWAVFILIHIQDHRSRKHAVLELLIRHISLHPDEEEESCETFLMDVLKIPTEWLHEAKAVKAGYLDEKEEEAWHWLKAGQWNKAHQLIMNNLASRAIVNENFTDLKHLLVELAAPEVSCTVEDWDKAGCVFLDYITMMETLQQLQQSEPSVIELDMLQSEVGQLSRCITGLKCRTATDRLCQSEMAKRAANLMRTLLCMKSDGDIINENLITEITDLPLPEDYALQELHELTRCYMLGLTAS